MSVAAGRRGEPFQRKSNPMQDVIRERKGGRPKWNEMSKVGSCETKKPLYCSFNAKTRVRIGSGFTWRKRWARLSGGHGPKSVLLSLCLLKTLSAAEILVITDPNANRSVVREFDFPFAYSPCSARSLRMRPSYMPIVFLCQSIS